MNQQRSDTPAHPPWYRRYFGLDYLRIYRLADTADQLDFLTTTLDPARDGRRLLDLPCGHGRHATVLAGHGFDVVGLDLSAPFLSVARHAAGKAGVRLALARADMRRVPLASAAFDVAICMFTSLGYFDTAAEHQAVLDEFARVVRPGGRLILDLASIEHVRQQPATAHWEKDGAVVDSEYDWSEATHRAVTRRWAKFTEGRDEYYESSVYLFEGDEIEAMLNTAGWQVASRQGAYAGGEIGAEQPRRILLCRRMGGLGRRASVRPT